MGRQSLPHLPTCLENAIGPKRPLGTYEWLAIVAGLVYLSLPLLAIFPGLYSTIGGIPPLEDQRLANFRSLMLVVSPIGLIYLFGVWARATSLTDLTVVWRLAWVGPWVALNWALGHLEPGGALFIGSVDVLLPLLAVAVGGNAILPRLADHIRKPPPSPVHRALLWEGRIGLVATLIAGLVTAATMDQYVVSFVIGVLGCYFLFVGWAARVDGRATMAFAVFIRLVLVCALGAAQVLGYSAPAGSIFLAVLLGSAVASGYTYLWHRWVRVDANVSPTHWMIAGGLAVIALSLLWSIGGPWYGDTCEVLAFNIHRQDLIIGMFAILIGLLLADVHKVAARHALAVSWLMPLAAFWFTSETKLLCHLGAGSPFHPSWTARELAPVWSGNFAVDLSFSLATALLTAIGTTYTAAVCLRWVPRSGWRMTSWNGVAIILVSALWMIATSSGVPGLVPALEGTAIPPLLPGNVVSCVQVHVSDLVIGLFLIAGGLLFDLRGVGMPYLPRATVVGGWLLTLLPKLFVHLGWI